MLRFISWLALFLAPTDSRAHTPVASAADLLPWLAVLLLALLAGFLALRARDLAARLAGSRQRYLTVFNEAPVAFIVSDRRQSIVDWNRAAEQIFGWTRAEARGRNLFEILVPNSDLHDREERLDTLMRTGSPMQAVTRNATRDGRILLCEWRFAPYHDDDGTLRGTLLLGTDITERRSLEDNLRQAKDRAEQLLADQRQFMAMVSHEFRSPLAVIDSASQILEMHGDSASNPANVVVRIRRGVKRLTTFLDNCLTEDRLDTHGWQLDLKDIELEAFLLSVLEQARALVSRHILKLENTAGNIRLRADPQLLGVLLQNLLDNAVKYSPGGSTITLGAAASENGQLQLTVCDQGMGIEPEDRANVLNKYQRGRNVAQISGAGLGLSLVSRIVALHDGDLHLESRPGVGTEVTIQLPITGPASA